MDPVIISAIAALFVGVSIGLAWGYFVGTRGGSPSIHDMKLMREAWRTVRPGAVHKVEIGWNRTATRTAVALLDVYLGSQEDE